MMTDQITMENAEEWHVCGVVVQGRPDKLTQISEKLLEVPNTEIHGSDPVLGKLVVVMQSHNQRILLENMENARNIDGVINVSLVYHQQDLAD
ncbi:chaperone NapD [Gallibacterium faecale]